MKTSVRTGIVAVAGAVALGTIGFGASALAADDDPITKRDDTTQGWVQSADLDDDPDDGNGALGGDTPTHHTANTVNTKNTVNTVNTKNTVNTVNTKNTVNTVNTKNTANTKNSVDTKNTAKTVQSKPTKNTAPSTPTSHT